MDKFDLNNFDPTTQKLQDTADKYRMLTMATDWEEAIKIAKKDLQTMRIYISKTLKNDRDKAIKYQKDNIAKEKELLSIITPVEEMLDKQIEDKLMEEEMKKRVESMPIRQEELTNLGLQWQYDEQFILSMNFQQFMDFIQQEKARLFEIEREAKLKAEAEIKRQADLKEAEERGRLQAEQKAKEEAEAKEKARLDEIQKAKDAEESARVQAEAEKARLEKAERYRTWLSDNGYTEDNKQDYKIEKEWNTVILYKVVSIFNI